MLTLFLQFFVVFCYGGGIIEELFITFKGGNVTKFMLTVPLLTIFIGTASQILTVFLKQSKITDLIKKLQSMHDRADEESMRVYRNLILKLMRYYKIIIAVSGWNLIILKYLGFDNFKLILPTLYDFLAIGSFYHLFLFVNAIHYFLMVSVFFATEWLHVLIMVRIEANFAFLCKKIRKCANGNDLKENEDRLIDCIKHHCEIIK